eukprot:2214031-Pyramimonas_sp.AAC.1
MVAAFSTTFCRPVLKWTGALREVDPPLRLLRAEWNSQEVDRSLYMYAAHLVRYAFIAHGGSMGSVLAKLSYSDDCLDSLLQDYGRKQTLEKQELA